ncbi:MAG: FtsW/RodA/SpoVE family cell cycle protein [bacterium]|nr:FtsW/RodA/SpoVE family cell cycle protein [bacterium]
MILSHIKKLDWVLLGSATFLVSLGLLSLYSSSLGRADFGQFQKQLVFFGIGVFAMLVVSLVDWRILRNNSFLILTLYGVGIAALAGLLVFAPEVRGVQRWYRIGGLAIHPLEFVKIILIVLAAKYFSMRHVEMYRIQHILISGLYFGVPAFLVFLQPDLGSSLLILFMWVSILLVAGISWRHFFALALVAALVFSVGWNVFLHDYQKDRLIGFVAPELDPLGMGWSQTQARIAVGNGGLLGQGIGQGTQTQYGFLSEPQTDFIFSAIAEEFGLLGVLSLFIGFGVFLWRVLHIGLDVGGNFARLFAVGFATLFIVHIGINGGMNLGFLPIIGLPLPLVSYGGSSLVMSFVGIGILQSMKTKQS